MFGISPSESVRSGLSTYSPDGYFRFGLTGSIRGLLYNSPRRWRGLGGLSGATYLPDVPENGGPGVV